MRRPKTRGLILLLLLLTGMCAKASARTFRIPDHLRRVNLVPYLDYYEDPSGALTVTDVRSPAYQYRFQPSDAKSMNFGFSHSTFWLRIRVDNPTRGVIQWILQYHSPLIDYLTLYSPEAGEYTETAVGDRLPFSARPIPYRAFAFPIWTPPGSHVYYLKLRSKGTLGVLVTAWEPGAFARSDAAQQALIWLFYGILLALACHNIFLYLKMRERTYLFLTLLIAALAAFSLTYNGLGVEFFWPDNVAWANWFHPVSLLLADITGLLFVWSFLNVRRFRPMADRILRWGMGGAALALGLAMVGPYRVASVTGAVFTGLTIIMIAVTGFISLFDARHEMRGFLLVMAFCLAGTAVELCQSVGVLPESAFREISFPIGLAGMLIVLSLNLADQMRLREDQRVRMLDAVTASEKLYRGIFENATEGIFQTTPSGRLLTANPALIHLLGYDSPQAFFRSVGDPVTQLLVDADERRRLIRAIKRERGVQGVELRTRRRDGIILHLSVSIRAITDADGNLQHFQGIVHDITRLKTIEENLVDSKAALETRVEENTQELVRTSVRLEEEIRERKVTEIALRKSEQRYRTILENIDDAYYEVDLAGNLIFFNDALCRLSGFERKELVGMNNRHLMAPEAARDTYNVFNKVFLTGSADKLIIYEMIGKHGRRISIELSVSLLRNENGRSIGFHGIARDITQRKQAERELKKARDAAEAANAAKSQFLANMSHEIRTPMNGILGMSGLLAETRMNPRQREYVGIIQSSATILLDLINDILDFSKIEAGKLRIERIPFSLHQVIGDVVSTFAGRQSEKAIEFVVDIEGQLPDRLIGDPLRLRQILINLVSNAFKFTDSGEIVISVTGRRIGRQILGLLFCVRDTGRGISSEFHDQIFDAFSQADGSTTRQFGGTGLGLAICRQLVSVMNGRIWVSSATEQGCRFFFRLQFALDPSSDGTPAPVPEAWQGRQLLVIDDNRTVRRVVSGMLEGFGFQVQVAESVGNGIAMLKTMESKPPAIAFIDSGLVAESAEFDQLLQAGVEAAVRVVIMGEGRRFCTWSNDRFGDVGFIEKPILSDTLRAILRTILGGGAGPHLNGPDPCETAFSISGIRVLVAEDNAINQRVIQEILLQAGARVEVVADGREACQALKRSGGYDLVLMDIHMPVMDGLEATQCIRREPDLTSLPIIALTARTMEDDRKRCLESGMNDYVAKPIERSELFAAIARTLKRPLPAIRPTEAAVLPEPVVRILPLAGLDMEDGLGRFGQNLDLFVEVLNGYAEQYREFVGEFQKRWAVLDWRGAGRLAHSLKGTAGNISAKGLAATAAELEAICEKRGGGNVERILEAVQSALDEVQASVLRLTAAIREDSSPTGTSDSERMRHWPTALGEKQYLSFVEKNSGK